MYFPDYGKVVKRRCVKFIAEGTSNAGWDDDDDFPGDCSLPKTTPVVKGPPQASPDIATPPIVQNVPATRTSTTAVPAAPTMMSVRPRTPATPAVPGNIETPQVQTPRRPVLADVFAPQPEDDIFETPIVTNPNNQDVDDRRYPLRGNRGNKPKRLEDYASYNHDVCCMSAARQIPETYRQAIDSPDSPQWKDAMEEEMKSLEENDTFDVVPLPQGATAVGGRWVYTVKNSDKNPVFKARYVAKGYAQVEGRDYFDTFAPTPKMTTIRSVMQISVQNDLVVHQMDVKTAYLNAPIDCIIYVAQPDGYKSAGKFVWKLKKSLYGLKQSGKNWNDCIHKFFMESGFIRSDADPCLYHKTDESGYVLVVLWVDDIILSGTSLECLMRIKQLLKDRFKMKDLGPIDSFLGITFLQTEGGIAMDQSVYLRNILDKFDMSNAKPRGTPCELNPSASNPSRSTDIQTPRRYREIVGSLIYAMTCTRPDICWVVTKLSQHLDNPDDADWVMAKHVLRYIKGTLDHKLFYTKSDGDLCLVGASDSDWGSSKDDRRSTTGYVFMLNPSGPPISWKSKKQATVALSSCEAEYMALAAAVQESLFLYMLLKCYLSQESINIFVDNQGTIDLASKYTTEKRSKHIDIRYHFIRERISSGFIDLTHVPTENNVADIMTKPVSKVKLERFCRVLFGARE